MPILGENDVLECGCGFVNRIDDSGAVGNGECATRAEIILHVDDDQYILPGDLHRVF